MLRATIDAQPTALAQETPMTTRKSPTPAADDATQLWNQWLEQQQATSAAQYEQLLQLQQQWQQAWMQAMQAWWAPWTPFLERGGEQLA